MGKYKTDKASSMSPEEGQAFFHKQRANKWLVGVGCGAVFLSSAVAVHLIFFSKSVVSPDKESKSSYAIVVEENDVLNGRSHQEQENDEAAWNDYLAVIPAPAPAPTPTPTSGLSLIPVEMVGRRTVEAHRVADR